MPALCPCCFKRYKDVWSKRSCDCTAKLIDISDELVDVVKLLINLGFKVACAYCDTLEDYDGDGKRTKIDIVFKSLYPHTIFDKLPPDWKVGDFNRVIDNEVVGEPFTILTCVCEHPPSECDQESIDFDKKVTITNLETWLEEKDPEAMKAILLLHGCG